MDEINALPMNLEAEQALLGQLLFDNDVHRRVHDAVTADDFAEPYHQRLYSAACDLIGAGKLADPTTLQTALSGDPAFADFGGRAYLIDLFDRAPPANQARDYAALVADQAVRRRLIKTASETIQAARNPEVSGFQVVAQARAELEAAERGAAPEDALFVNAHDAAQARMDRLEVEVATGKPKGVQTGLVSIDKRLGGLMPGSVIVMAGRPGMGKAQPLNAKVLLADGSWTTMGALSFGSQLASVDGHPSVVTGIYPQGEREVFRVTLSDGRSTLACAEHLWTVESCKWPERRRTVTTADLKGLIARTRYQRRISLPLVSGDFGTDDNLPMDPWLLGAILGNGGIAGASVMFSTADAATLFRVQKVVGSDRVRHAGGDYDYRIVANDCTPEQNVSYALVALGLKGLHSYEKFIPDAYLKASRQSRLCLLQGLLDTDGWVETFGAVRITLSSEQLANGVQALVRSLGGACTIKTKTPTYVHKGEKREGRTAYVCNIAHPDRSSLMTLARKRRRCSEPMRFHAPTVVSVESVGTEPVQCIAVSHPQHLYVTDDYIVTHNTALLGNVLYNAAAKNPNKLFAGFSLEMDADQLNDRALSRLTAGETNPVNFSDIAKVQPLTGFDLELLHQVKGRIPKNLWLRDRAGVSVEDVSRAVWAMKRRGDLAAIGIDYLQLMRRPALAGRNEASAIAEMTGALKTLAREAKICIILLSQLNRGVESRDDKRPMLSDLRESGSIEQDADAVVFPFREVYYLQKSEPKAGTEAHMLWEAEVALKRTQMDIIIAKNRHGSEGVETQDYRAEVDLITDREGF
jgi:replicative DNA helicase